MLYVLDEHNNPVPSPHPGLRGEERKRVGGDDSADGQYHVSTMFLRVDHQLHDGGPPLLFETMVFTVTGKTTVIQGMRLPLMPTCSWQEDDGEWCGQRRYSTWAEAEAGHKEVLAAVNAGRVKEDYDE